MRSYLIITVVALGAFWMFDRHKYDGRYSHAAWQQTVAEVRIYTDSFTDLVNRAIGRAMSGKCALCD
jgi:hypothetical protein